MTEKTVFALGFFDGVHVGHQLLLSGCRELAGKLGCKAGVLTFENHPDALVFGKTPGLINTVFDRNALLTRIYGMDRVVSLPFDRELMNMPWEDFYRMLREKYDAAGLVCGEDFSFGRGGKGNAKVLQEVCKSDGIPCTVVPQKKMEGQVVSSTYIRSLMEAGDTEKMTRFLGHPHRLTGTVVPGKQLGRTLGIPTANLSYPPELQLLRKGVYACRVLTEEGSYPAVTNVGSRPTVGGDSVTVESWLLSFAGDLYGKEITVEFFAFLRPEKKFDSLSDLQAEIQKNAAETRKIFDL